MYPAYFSQQTVAKEHGMLGRIYEKIDRDLLYLTLVIGVCLLVLKAVA